MPNLKNDYQSAAKHWGFVEFDLIPKAAFAVVAWHLANVASGQAGEEGAARARFLEEAEALSANGILPAGHLKAIRRALERKPS